jgi:hypothetical protein
MVGLLQAADGAVIDIVVENGVPLSRNERTAGISGSVMRDAK